MEKDSGSTPNYQEHIKGRFIDIDFTELPAVLPHISGPSNTYRELIYNTDEKTLPPYVREISLCFWDERLAEDMPELVGTISFEPELVEGRNRWVQQYLGRLETALIDSHIINIVEHDTAALHVHLDENYAVRISVATTLNECSVELTLEQMGDLENMLGQMFNFDRQEASDPGVLLCEMSKVLGIAADGLIAEFSSTGKRRRYLLELLQPEEANDEEPDRNQPTRVNLGKTTTKQVVLFTSAPVDMETPPEEELEVGKKGLSSIGGLFAPKRRLGEIAEDFGGSEASTLYGITPTYFLLHGAPGNGKTSLVGAFAEEIDADLVTISAADVSDKWVGGSAKNLKKAIDAAVKDGKPTVIFFDEIDGIIGSQTSGSNHIEAKRLLQTMLTDMPKSHPNVVFAAATNFDLGDLDPAFIRPGRFETIEVPMPTKAERQDIWATIITESRQQFDSEWNDGEHQEVGFVPYENVYSYDYENLAEMTNDWTGADITVALERARRRCFGEYKRTGELQKVTNEILFDVIRTYGLY